jgi:DNA uptake protein ComE-like DNA-binding protein
MNRKHACKAATALATILTLTIISIALSAEPAAQPKATAEEVPAAEAQPAVRNENPQAPAEAGRKRSPLKSQATKATSQAEATKVRSVKRLIAPAGLLSRAPSVPRSTAPGMGKLDLNTATLEQIQRLPGVGLTWAPRILAGRPYRTLGELARDGIPYTTIDALAREVELGP